MSRENNDEGMVVFWLERHYETNEVIDVEMIRCLPASLEFNQRLNNFFQENWQDIIDPPEDAEVVFCEPVMEPGASVYQPETGVWLECIAYD